MATSIVDSCQNFTSMAAMIRPPPLPTSSRTYLSSLRTGGVSKDAAGNGPEPFVRTLARACIDDDDKRELFNQADVKVDDPVLLVFDGHEVELWSRIVWKPKWGLTFSDVKSKVHGKCSVTQKSAMVINAPNCHIVDLSLDGALIMDAANGTGHDEVSGPVQNKGWTIESVDYKDTSVSEEVMIGGFKINKIEQLVRP